jgi:hypothetical protein
MRDDRFRGGWVPAVLVLTGGLLSSYVVGLPILVVGIALALRQRDP